MTQTYRSKGIDISAATFKFQNYYTCISLEFQKDDVMQYMLLISIDNERSIHNKKLIHIEWVDLAGNEGDVLTHINLIAEKAKKNIKMCNFNMLER